MRSLTSLSFSLLFLVFAVGCSESAPTRIQVVPVRGKLMRSGQPVGGAQVTLHPDASSQEKLGALRPNGKTASDGSFLLTTYTKDDGVPEGTYQVAVVWPDENYQPRTPEEREDFHVGAPKPDKLQGRFQDPTRSGVTAAVTTSTTELLLVLP